METLDSRQLTPAQRELLKLFDRPLSEAEWLEIRDLLTQYFAERATRAANQVWDEKGWGIEDAERMLREHARRKSA